MFFKNDAKYSRFTEAMVQENPETVEEILHQLENTFGSLGFEFHPFKIGWYNCFVQPVFKLTYDEDTVAFLVVSSPKMFENAFVPFLQKHYLTRRSKDAIDECMTFYLSKIPELLSGFSVKVVYDFELHPNRRPKIIMQSAAHASGAAYLYRPEGLNLTTEKKMFGVCIHPKYGGWFALRAVVFLENMQCPDLQRTPPINVVPSVEDQRKLLELYNFSWYDWKFRDIISVKDRYSDLQIKYFTAPPGKRAEIIEDILDMYNGKC